MKIINLLILSSFCVGSIACTQFEAMKDSKSEEGAAPSVATSKCDSEGSNCVSGDQAQQNEENSSENAVVLPPPSQRTVELYKVVNRNPENEYDLLGKASLQFNNLIETSIVATDIEGAVVDVVRTVNQFDEIGYYAFELVEGTDGGQSRDFTVYNLMDTLPEETAVRLKDLWSFSSQITDREITEQKMQEYQDFHGIHWRQAFFKDLAQAMADSYSVFVPRSLEKIQPSFDLSRD